jgi:hypothetical protein
MVDERGEKCKWWKKSGKGNMRQLPVYSPGESVTFLVYEHDHLHTCHSRHGILDVLRRFRKIIHGCAVSHPILR